MTATASLSISDLSFSYGPKTALDGVSFTLSPGEFCALLGPNGAGKSTLFSLMTRLFTSPQGKIAVAGHDLSRDHHKALAAMGVVFQQTTLDLDLSVRRNLSYFAALHGIAGRDCAHRIDRVLDRLAMRERAGERARDLNGGHRRRVEIARALLHDPQVLLLDEPTVGLDAATRTAITDHVHDLARDQGLTVLWATHLTDEVHPDDRLLVLHRGRLQADTTASGLAPDGDLKAAFLDMTGGVDHGAL